MDPRSECVPGEGERELADVADTMLPPLFRADQAVSL